MLQPVSHLIYPLPEAAGLGVHLTPDLQGQAKFGSHVQWVQSPEDLPLAPERAQRLYAEIRKYWPALPDATVQPGYTGIRPKIADPDEASADFCIPGPSTHGIHGLVNLFGIESPGLTSALAIAKWVRGMV